MKKNKTFFCLITGIMLLVLAGCGARGGTITLINESTTTLTNVEISLGKSKVETLYPGQWMKAGVDKNITGANVKFSTGVVIKPEDSFKVSHDGIWFLGRFTSGLIGLSNGASVVVTIRDIQK